MRLRATSTRDALKRHSWAIGMMESPTRARPTFATTTRSWAACARRASRSRRRSTPTRSRTPTSTGSHCRRGIWRSRPPRAPARPRRAGRMRSARSTTTPTSPRSPRSSPARLRQRRRVRVGARSHPRRPRAPPRPPLKRPIVPRAVPGRTRNWFGSDPLRPGIGPNQWRWQMAASGLSTDGIMLTHFIVSDDVERSRRFYTDVLGGTLERSGEPTNIALANSWIVINRGGGPTDDKPAVTLERRRTSTGSAASSTSASRTSSPSTPSGAPVAPNS